jgi:hypothetical protein
MFMGDQPSIDHPGMRRMDHHFGNFNVTKMLGDKKKNLKTIRPQTIHEETDDLKSVL